ncbi:hypothetical protein HPB47_017445, partial [Ixodes persulcatus]
PSALHEQRGRTGPALGAGCESAAARALARLLPVQAQDGSKQASGSGEVVAQLGQDISLDLVRCSEELVQVPERSTAQVGMELRVDGQPTTPCWSLGRLGLRCSGKSLDISARNTVNWSETLPATAAADAAAVTARGTGSFASGGGTCGSECDSSALSLFEVASPVLGGSARTWDRVAVFGI